MSLLGSLGLDNVEAAGGELPVGKYAGEVARSSYVVTKAGIINHVITYKVTEGPRKGAEKDEWWAIGDSPVYDETPAHRLIGMNPTMSESAKTWYKKRWVDLGVPEDKVAECEPDILTGTPVDFGIKDKDGYKNISFVSKRSGAATAAATWEPSAESLDGPTASVETPPEDVSNLV